MSHPIAIKIRSLQRFLLDWTVRHNPGLGLDKRAEGFVRLFEKSLPAQSRILDIGGGWGFYFEPLARRGHNVIVLDVNRPEYHRAPVVLVEPGSPFPFADKSFDASLIITALHHIDDPEAVIREAKRVTRGVVIVVEDLYRHALGRFWTVLRDRFYNFEFFGHPCNFKKKAEWVALFEKLGFRLEGEQEVYTKLAGMRILNGVFVFRVPG